MAENQGFWGIDIGQAGLKAIRLRHAEAAGQAIAVAFDYVPHPKLLSQPDAVPGELIRQALERFLSRNDVHGDLVAISVPGQTALARFIQLPPVEAGKVAEIVKYEARQQIPFDLDDVIWDYQTLGGTVEESGFMLEAEVGLFAMKRDQVQQHLQPFIDANVEVELIQIAPLALYNYLSYDVLGIRPDDEVTGGDEFTIVLDMGADNTTLMVSNGEKIWIRNVPIGGNHFTRALTKEMKLTFAKAEHLKKNATRSPDPRAVFQALRPVFNDYVSEIQRSIGYFSSVNRNAKIVKVLGLGNGFKLAGLQKFLQQNLQHDVERVEAFNGLVGDTVLGARLFEENIMSFAVPYGLALQVMGQTRAQTSLLPPEITTARMIRRKKPWAVAAAATLLVGMGLSTALDARVWKSVSPERFQKAENQVEDLTKTVGRYKSAYGGATGAYQKVLTDGAKLVRGTEAREYWLELYKAINECLPHDTGDRQDIKDITKRRRIKLESITAEKVPDLSTWFKALPQAAKNRMLDLDEEHPPEGKGYVFTLQGVHYYHDPNDPKYGQNVNFVMETLLKNLQKWKLRNSRGQEIPVRQIGITHATIIADHQDQFEYDPKGMQYRQLSGSRVGPVGGMTGPDGNPLAAGGFGGRRGGLFQRPGTNIPGATVEPTDPSGTLPTGTPGDLRKSIGLPPGASTDDKSEVKLILRTSFTLQFVWKITPRDKRSAEPPKEESSDEK